MPLAGEGGKKWCNKYQIPIITSINGSITYWLCPLNDDICKDDKYSAY
jgi:hypothetical protein